MDNRKRIILEVCQMLSMEKKLGVISKHWIVFRIILFLLGFAFVSRLEAFCIGFGLVTLSLLDVKNAGNIIMNSLKAREKEILISYIHDVFEGMQLVDAESTLSALSDEQKHKIMLGIILFFDVDKSCYAQTFY
nr:uncharacterized protein LOC111512061 [Leptinotarsa decemlineata]